MVAQPCPLIEVCAVLPPDVRHWSAWVEALPGCATWGFTQEEALHNIHDAVEAYIHVMHNAGERVPTDATTQVLNDPVVAVTV